MEVQYFAPNCVSNRLEERRMSNSISVFPHDMIQDPIGCVSYNDGP
jgi:hypothetical protein